MPQLSLHTPVGALTVSEEAGRVLSIDWGWGRDQTRSAVLVEAKAQLDAYFDGHLTEFDLPLDPGGTPFQRRVWEAISQIPFGQTQAYGIVAGRTGGSARAVGQANARNRLPILVPCHRVVGSVGLGGYSGGDGITVKEFLLSHERRFAQRAN